MRPPSDSYVSRVLLGTPVHPRSLNAGRRRWRWLRTSVFDSYRPELHYMRGPGPKCRERDNASAWP
jgi:hypothetical protein